MVQEKCGFIGSRPNVIFETKEEAELDILENAERDLHYSVDQLMWRYNAEIYGGLRHSHQHFVSKLIKRHPRFFVEYAGKFLQLEELKNKVGVPSGVPPAKVKRFSRIIDRFFGSPDKKQQSNVF